MSGGSYDYAYRHVDEMADTIDHKTKSSLRRAFAAHLRKVALAMHHIEWVDSGDYGNGQDEGAMRACLADPVAEELTVAVGDAREVSQELQRLLSVADVRRTGKEAG